MNAIREDKLARALTMIDDVPVDALDPRAAELIETAKDTWLKAGAPHRRDEYWRYSEPALLFGDKSCETKALPWNIEAIDLDLESSVDSQAVKVMPLNTALTSAYDAIADHFGQIALRGSQKVERPLAQLITAKARDGLVLIAEAENEERFCLDYGRSEKAKFVHHIIHVRAGANLTLVETGDKNLPEFSLIEVYVEKGGSFDHVRLQGEGATHVGAQYLFGDLEDGCDVRSFTLSGGAKLRRNESVLTLKGRDCHLSIAGASYLDGAALHDDTVFIEHCDENCVSRQVFKKVVRDGAKSVFQGKIYVHPEAQKTDGYQISQGLMLDDNSEVYNKPELEIYADDVACSHGSTTSGADGEAIFYLKSRGIEAKDAQNMLALAFMDEAIEEIRDEALQDDVRALLASWIEISA